MKLWHMTRDLPFWRNALILFNYENSSISHFSELESKHEFVVKVRELVKSWPRPVFIVMRYLFAFLQHLSTYRYIYCPKLGVKLHVLYFNNCLCLIVYHFFPQQRSIEKLSPFPKFPDNEVCLLPSLPVKFKEGRYSLNSHWNLIKVHQTQIRAEIKLRRCLQRAKSEPIMFYVKLNTPNV